MYFWAQVVGFIAVFFYLLGYLQRRRGYILLFNLTSRILYILQYLMLGAFSGAVLDVAGALSTVFAQKKNTPWIQKHLKAVIAFVNVVIVGAGIYVMVISNDIFGFLPIIGVMFHTNAFWIDDEKKIRRLSMVGSPFWLAYNFISKAYFSCVGDTLSIVSIGVAMYRYDRKKSRVKD